MDERKLAVLRAIITDYVENSEPVGSRALVERHHLDVSPATIRNDMAILEEEGYLTQPHTSAGRVPTDKGYRLFVDRLASVKTLSQAEQRAITTFMAGAADTDDVIDRTVRLLAQLTQQVAMVQYPPVSTSTVRHIDLVRLGGERGLVILVTSTGRVCQAPIDLPADYTDDDLHVTAQRLIATIRGLPSLRAAQQLDTEARTDASALYGAAAEALRPLLAVDSSARVVVGGVPNLTRFADQYETLVQPVLEALEEQVVLLRLLGDAHDEVTVRIGHENDLAGLAATSVVASGYGVADDVWAKLGVVGPTRMDYPSTMAAVRAVGRYVGRFLAEG